MMFILRIADRVLTFLLCTCLLPVLRTAPLTRGPTEETVKFACRNVTRSLNRIVTNSLRRVSLLPESSCRKGPGARRRRPLRGCATSFETLEPLMLLDGTATVEILSPPSHVEPGERVDITVRYKMTGSKGGPFLVEELSIRDNDGGFFNRIARTDGQRFSSQNRWYTHTFRGVDLSAFDDGGNGVELYAHVDIDNQAFGRADATDNSGQFQVTVGIPDLQIKSLAVSDSTVDPGQKVEIDAVVTNGGSRAAASSTVKYYFGPEPGSRQMFIGDGRIGKLDPNENEKDSPTFPPQPDFAIPNVRGTYYITAVADADHAIDEVNEQNNERSIEITVGVADNPNPDPVARLVCRAPSGAGVTVITHGFTLGGGPDSRSPDWMIEMAEGIVQRSGTEGSILLHDPESSRWVPPGERDASLERKNTNDLDDEIVLVFDWTWESNDFQDGWLEAAADSLFANLISPFGFTTDSSRSLLTRPFHFIGHSRGTVVNSLVAQRLNYFFPEFSISQFTTLDPHPSVNHNDPGHEERMLTIPDNIQWADNYYREDGLYEADLDFNGVPVRGARNLQLNESVLSGEGHREEHKDAYLWYLATIKDGADTVEGFDVGDPDFSDWWVSGEAYDAAVEPLSGREHVGFARSRLGGSPLLVEQMDRESLLPATAPAIVFNGDFELGAELTNEIPGWERHGGGGTGNLDGLGNNYLQLNDNDHVRTHNDLYLPPTVTALEFDYWINNNDGLNSNDRLEISIGSEVIGSISLKDETGGFIRDYRLPLPARLVGSVNTIQFRIGGSGDIQSAVRVDNVRLVEGRPTRLIDIDVIHDAIAADATDAIFDLNRDSAVDAADGAFLLDYCRTLAGDANLDGRFDTTDLLAVFTAGRFENGETASWHDGDWNFDGLFDSNDLLDGLKQGGYESENVALAAPARSDSGEPGTRPEKHRGGGVLPGPEQLDATSRANGKRSNADFAARSTFVP